MTSEPVPARLIPPNTLSSSGETLYRMDPWYLMLMSTSAPEVLPQELSSSVPRRGKWTVEEERYTEKVIMDFDNGTLNVAEGVTLRSYLSRVLNCDPMRITKKYTGSSSIGKRTFTPLPSTPENQTYIKMSQRDLEDLRRTWINKLLIAEQWNARKISMLKSGVGGATGFYEGPYGVYGAVGGAAAGPRAVGEEGLSGSHMYAPYYSAHHPQGSRESAYGMQGGGVSLTHSLSVPPSALPPLDLMLQVEPEELAKRREENIRYSLLQYLHNANEVETLLAWLRGCTSALRSNNPSLGEISSLIEKGEGEVSHLYHTLLAGNSSNGHPVQAAGGDGAAADGRGQFEQLQRVIEAYLGGGGGVPPDVVHRMYGDLYTAGRGSSGSDNTTGGNGTNNGGDEVSDMSENDSDGAGASDVGKKRVHIVGDDRAAKSDSSPEGPSDSNKKRARAAVENCGGQAGTGGRERGNSSDHSSGETSEGCTLQPNTQPSSPSYPSFPTLYALPYYMPLPSSSSKSTPATSYTQQAPTNASAGVVNNAAVPSIPRVLLDQAQTCHPPIGSSSASQTAPQPPSTHLYPYPYAYPYHYAYPLPAAGSHGDKGGTGKGYGGYVWPPAFLPPPYPTSAGNHASALGVMSAANAASHNTAAERTYGLLPSASSLRQPKAKGKGAGSEGGVQYKMKKEKGESAMKESTDLLHNISKPAVAGKGGGGAKVKRGVASINDSSEEADRRGEGIESAAEALLGLFNG
eukprot:gene24260-29333_t